MDVDIKVLLGAMAMTFVVGMAIFLLWKLFEPKREGESRSLMDSVVKPAAVMAGGIMFIGLCMVVPRVLGWTFAALGVIAVIAYLRMPAKDKQKMTAAVGQPDPRARSSVTRLIVAVVIVFAVVVGILTYFAPS